MRRISKQNLYGKNVHLVELSQEELQLPHPVLVSMADGHSKNSALECHEKQQHPGHFGGKVEYRRSLPNGGMLTNITVWID